jgi:DNA-binding Lrp family transcriptional regulator
MADTIDILRLRESCAEYVRTAKAADVLRNANGKASYKEIAKKLDMPPTTVSGLLKKAERLGLARKVSSGLYKKNPGVLSYMPSRTKSKKREPRTVATVVERLTGKKPTKQPPSFSPSLSIEQNAERMALAYRLLFATENILRDLIRRVLGQIPNWWKVKVPAGVQTAVAETITKEVYHAAKRRDELEYSHLGQLMEIIVKNWNDFLPYLNERDKSAFSATIRKAIPSRNATGHCIPLSQRDYRVVEVRLTDILAMLK